MRWLFCRRDGINRSSLIPIAALVVTGLTWPAGAVAEDPPPPSVRITSPLGRTGLADTVRIVARVTAPAKLKPAAVRFYVDDTLLSVDADGPPYVAEWSDVSPFERCGLAVEVTFDDATVIRDQLTLEPLDFVESMQVMSVGLEATVQDVKGKYVPTLVAGDFDLREDGVAQSLDSLSVEAVPSTFALLIDASQSMSRSIPLVRQAAARFVEHLRADDSIVIAPFRDAIVDITGPTRDAATIAEAVAAIHPKGGTAILDALATAAERFAEGDRRVIVLVTDGYDERSQGSVDRTLAVLKRAQVIVHVIAIGGIAGVSLNGEALLRRLAAETGGRVFFPWNGAELAIAHAAIAEDARSRYRMAYTPSNQRQDGTWRRIELAVREPGYQVRTRAGFTAPAPPPVRASLEFTAISSVQDYLDLTRDELEVVEDGITQTLDSFHEAVAPVSIMLALDGSGSMKRAAPQVQEAVRAFVATMRPSDALGMIVFADAPQLMHGFSLDRDESARAVAAYTAQGGTALYDALEDGFAQLATREGRRVLLVVSDGRDENAKSTGPGSRHTWEAVLSRARDLDVTVYAIGLGSKVDTARLTQLTSMTGGEAYVAANVSELEQHYRRIVEELRRRYVVTYTSTNGVRDGSWRTVQIRPRAAGVRVRSRDGYFAPTLDY